MRKHRKIRLEKLCVCGELMFPQHGNWFCPRDASWKAKFRGWKWAMPTKAVMLL